MQEKLLIMRKKNHVTGQQMASLLGITPQAYHQKEFGKRPFNINEMFKISDFFKLSIEEIFLPHELQNGVKKEEK